MAKTILEKLTAVLASASELKEAAVVGEAEGQYSEEHVHALTKYIESAHAVAINEQAEESHLEAELTAISNALKAFKSSAVKAIKAKEEIVSLRGVVLRGAANFKKGTHSLHVGGKIVNFVDGRADVLPGVAAELEKDGFIE